MTDLAQDLQKVKAQVTNLARDRARKEAEIDRLKESIKNSVGVLKNEFGVSNLDDAQELLAKLEAELKTDIAKLIADIEEAAP